MTSSKTASGKKSFLSLFFALVIAVMAVYLLPTTIILVLGMIPTAVAYFVDTSNEKNLGPTVFFLNFAGLSPVLFKLWKTSHTVPNAIELMLQPFSMLLILIFSAFAWLLYLYIPPVIGIVMRKRAESRIRELERYQKDLVEQWGDHVIKTAHPVDKKLKEPAKAEVVTVGGDTSSISA